MNIIVPLATNLNQKSGDYLIDLSNYRFVMLVTNTDGNPKIGQTVICPVGEQGTLVATNAGSYYFTISREFEVFSTKITFKKAYYFGWNNASGRIVGESDDYLTIKTIYGIK